jgi:hypothetical protein
MNEKNSKSQTIMKIVSIIILLSMLLGFVTLLFQSQYAPLLMW